MGGAYKGQYIHRMGQTENTSTVSAFGIPKQAQTNLHLHELKYPDGWCIHVSEVASYTQLGQ